MNGGYVCCGGDFRFGNAASCGVEELKKYGKRVIAFSGCAAEDAAVCNDCGIDAFFPIVQGITTLEEALKPDNAYRNLYRTACQVFRLIRAYTADC